MVPCSSQNLLGGPLNFDGTSSISKLYTGIPYHYQARITFMFMKIDLWSNNKLLVSIDSIQVFSLAFSPTEDTSVMKLCGTTSEPEALRRIDILSPHYSPTLTIKIYTDLTTSGGSWGIYDYSISISYCHMLCKTCNGPLSSHCLSCNFGLYLQSPLGPSTCEPLCPDGLFSEGSSLTCNPCHAECAKCFGPSNHECLGCVDSMFLLKLNETDSYCIQECPIEYFTIVNICSHCDMSCKTCVGGGV